MKPLFKLTCDFCGASFERRQKDNRSKHFYCSNDCRGKSIRKDIKLTCSWCKCFFYRIPSNVVCKTNYCSIRCAAKDKYTGGISVSIEKWRAKNKHKIIAHSIVAQEIKTGRMLRGTMCEVCHSKQHH